MLKEITNKQKPKVSKEAIIELEKGFRSQIVGEEAGQVEIVLS